MGKIFKIWITYDRNKEFTMTPFEELLADVESSPDHNLVKLTYSRFVSKSQYYSKRPRIRYIRDHMDLNAGKYALSDDFGGLV